MTSEAGVGKTAGEKETWNMMIKVAGEKEGRSSSSPWDAPDVLSLSAGAAGARMSYRETHKRVLHDCTYSIVHTLNIVLFNIYDRSARQTFTAEHCKHLTKA